METSRDPPPPPGSGLAGGSHGFLPSLRRPRRRLEPGRERSLRRMLEEHPPGGPERRSELPIPSQFLTFNKHPLFNTSVL